MRRNYIFLIPPTMCKYDKYKTNTSSILFHIHIQQYLTMQPNPTFVHSLPPHGDLLCRLPSAHHNWLCELHSTSQLCRLLMRLSDKSTSINKQPTLHPGLIKLQCLCPTSVKMRLPLRRNAPLARELRLRLECMMACIQRDILKCVLRILQYVR